MLFAAFPKAHSGLRARVGDDDLMTAPSLDADGLRDVEAALVAGDVDAALSTVRQMIAALGGDSDAAPAGPESDATPAARRARVVREAARITPDALRLEGFSQPWIEMFCRARQADPSAAAGMLEGGRRARPAAPVQSYRARSGR